MIEQVFGRLKLLFAKGKGLRIGADKVQVRVLDEEPLGNIDRVEPYGFSYRPKPGCQAYLVFPQGDRSYGIALVIGDKQYQMDLQEGEVALHDDEGNWVLIKRGGTIHVKAATEVFSEAPLFKTSADAEIGGNLVVNGQTRSNGGYFGTNGGIAQMAGGLYVTGEFRVNGKNVSDSHTHPVSGDQTMGVN